VMAMCREGMQSKRSKSVVERETAVWRGCLRISGVWDQWQLMLVRLRPSSTGTRILVYLCHSQSFLCSW